MLLTTLTTIGLLSLATSALMLYEQLYNADFISQKRQEKYFSLSQKPKNTRTQAEQKFINRTWHQYWATKVRIVSFKFGIVILVIAMALNYVVK